MSTVFCKENKIYLISGKQWCIIKIHKRKGGAKMHIGDKIKSARLKKGLTQEALGELLGVQKSAIAKYESGRVVNIKRSTLKKISDILDIRPAELITDIEEIPVETAGLHARILTDNELMEAIKEYYELSTSSQKMVRDLIHNLKK
jgi:transcriptional regulator with XRE-family HTH domain